MAVESSAPADAAAKLRDVQSITDAALSSLDERSFLTELLERVKGVFQADTAALLLLDPFSRQLVAAAASGLEEEVRQGVRLPLGRGFAGRIATTGQPVVLSHVERGAVVNPILVDKGIRSLMGVPLMSGGEVIGVLHVGSLSAREFTAEDTGLLQIAADRAATAVGSMRARADRAAAAALERSLIPSAPPTVPGLELAARYVTGDGDVGGDWYDVFTLPSGELCVVMGDVAGAGLRAAVIMGRMRSSLRSYALDSPGPAVSLAKLDRKIQYFEPGALATVLFAMFDPDLERVRISSAGHLPPVVALPGEPACLAEMETDALIGLDPGLPRRQTTLPVPPGALLCFFTDGLVERRNASLDERLATLCAAIAPAPPEDVCANVMGAMVGNEAAADDIALLALRRVAPVVPGEARPGWPSVPPAAFSS